MRCRRILIQGWMCGLVILGLAIGCAAAPAKPMSVEEREKNSTFNEEYATWRSGYLQLSADTMPEGRAVACYRKVFELPAEPREAEVTFFNKSRDPYWIMVNDTVLMAPYEGSIQLGYIHNYNITEYLKPGVNVLSYRGECEEANNSRLTVEGMVHCENGFSMRILTDGWEGGWNAADGWENPETRTQGMGNLEAQGVPLRGNPTSLPPRPYYGPIHVEPVGLRPGMDEPIFDEENNIRLDLTLMNMQDAQPAPGLSLEVFNEMTREVLDTREVELPDKGGHDLGTVLDLGKMGQGAYRLRFVLTQNGEELDRRDYEVAVVGEIPMRKVAGTSFTDGMDLKEVYSIDCTAPTDPKDFVATNQSSRRRGTEIQEIETEVVEGPAGRYRQILGTQSSHNFAYRYEIETLFAPHVAVVEYPDDAARNMLIQIKEPGALPRDANSGWQRSDTSIITTHDLFPERTGRMQELHLLFWPNVEQGSIHICNMGEGAPPTMPLAPAAASRITIYEVTNGIPALEIADAGDRMIGPHSERGDYTMASTYYAGPIGGTFINGLNARDHAEYYRNWFATAENFIKRLRFAGMNLYLMGHFMYSGTLYPSEMWRYGYNNNRIGGNKWVRDNEALILRMFERNGINMVSGIEHFDVPKLTAQQPKPDEIRAGVDHLFSVTRFGTLFPVHSLLKTDMKTTWGSGRPREDGTMRWPAMNYFHPKVQERFLALVGELGDRYNKYPSWKGVAIFLSRVMGPMEPAYLRSDKLLQVGYEDYTIALFEEETGIDIPVDDRDPERFQKRYDWIMENILDEWINWRCAKYTELYRRLAERLAGDRDDVKLYLLLGEPMMWSGSQEMLDGRYDDQAFLLRTLKKFGFDLDVIAKDPSIVVTPIYALAGSGQALKTDGHQGWRELSQNQAWQNLLANNNAGGAYCKTNLTHYGAYEYPEGRWIFSGSGTRQGYLCSTYVTETFANVMARSNPTWMPHTWMDVTSCMARLQEKRQFARAYRSLPNAVYEKLTGNGLDRNIWISRTEKDGRDYAYAANLHWWEPTVTVQFSDGAEVYDRINNRPVALDDGAWTFTLAPYAIQTFHVTGGRVVSAESAIPGKDRAYVVSQIEEAIEESSRVLEEAKRRDEELSDKKGWEALPELEGRTNRLKAAYAEGDIAEAYRLTQGALPIARGRIALILSGGEIQRSWY